MTCLLNTYGKFSNLENIIKYLSNGEHSPLAAEKLFEKNGDAETSNSRIILDLNFFENSKG
jgi:hypothetical protein